MKFRMLIAFLTITFLLAGCKKKNNNNATNDKPPYMKALVSGKAFSGKFCQSYFVDTTTLVVRGYDAVYNTPSSTGNPAPPIIEFRIHNFKIGKNEYAIGTGSPHEAFYYSATETMKATDGFFTINYIDSVDWWFTGKFEFNFSNGTTITNGDYLCHSWFYRID